VDGADHATETEAAGGAARDAGIAPPAGSAPCLAAQRIWRRVGIVVLAALATTLLILGAYHLFGRELLVNALTREAQGVAADRVLRWRLEDTYRRLPDLMLGKLLVLVWALALLACLVNTRAARWFFARRMAGRVALSLLGMVAAWFVVDSFAAPFLIQRLDLFYFYSILDVDHRLPRGDPEIPTNADGIRCRREAAEFATEAYTVVFLGDSFTFGPGVRLEDTFPMQVEQLLRVRFPERSVQVANFGWVSSSPFLSRRLLADIGPRYAPDLVCLCVDMTDFFEDILYPAMEERRGLYSLYLHLPITLNLLRQHAPRTFWSLYYAVNDFMPRDRFFVTEAPLEQTRDRLRPLTRELSATRDLAQRLGADFVVFVLPRSYQYSSRECPDNPEGKLYTVLGPYSLEPFRFLDAEGARLGLPIFSLLDAFRQTQAFPTCFRNDPHWTPLGHRVAAEAIAVRLAERLQGSTRAHAPAPGGGD